MTKNHLLDPAKPKTHTVYICFFFKDNIFDMVRHKSREGMQADHHEQPSFLLQVIFPKVLNEGSISHHTSSSRC